MKADFFIHANRQNQCPSISKRTTNGWLSGYLQFLIQKFSFCNHCLFEALTSCCVILLFTDVRYYSYDDCYGEFAYTKPPYWWGYWTGLTFGKASRSALTSGCKYNRQLADTIVHEFMHFWDDYWYPYIIAGRICRCTGEDPHIYYDIAVQTFTDSIQECLVERVKGCCKRAQRGLSNVR